MAKLFKTIRPKKLFKQQVFKDAMKEGLEETGKLMLIEFNKTTRTFSEKNKPKFRIRTRVFKQPFTVSVTTTHKIYQMINNGTKAHVIKPTKPHGLLVFPKKTVAKTTPHLISSRKGSKSKAMVFVKGPVRVKGIVPRRFDRAIEKRIRPKFKAIMQRKFNEAADKSGYRRRKI